MTDATSRQRSAFADAVEILNELHQQGIPTEAILRGMQFTENEYWRAKKYMSDVHSDFYFGEKEKANHGEL